MKKDLKGENRPSCLAHHWFLCGPLDFQVLTHSSFAAHSMPARTATHGPLQKREQNKAVSSSALFAEEPGLPSLLSTLTGHTQLVTPSFYWGTQYSRHCVVCNWLASVTLMLGPETFLLYAEQTPLVLGLSPNGTALQHNCEQVSLVLRRPWPLHPDSHSHIS